MRRLVDDQDVAVRLRADRLLTLPPNSRSTRHGSRVPTTIRSAWCSSASGDDRVGGPAEREVDLDRDVARSVR